MKKGHIHIAANISATISLGLLLQQIAYCLHTLAFIDFSTFTGTQIIFQLMYVLSIGLVTMSEGLKVISVEPSKSHKTSHKSLENTYREA